MFKKIGFDVMKLQRVAIGKLRLGSLETGDYVYINDAARDRIFMQDLPTETHAKRDVRTASKKKNVESGNRKNFQRKLNSLK
jgi:23S rRNA pseudouridine2605 synthase